MTTHTIKLNEKVGLSETLQQEQISMREVYKITS